ncbi:MAG: HEAT repeat domain-containing protein [Kofleriaceae bacterium]|nr:HEAT repeat domain-containing protein [Kofleriaceae bacterium]
MSFLFPSPTITFEAALRDLVSGKPRSRAMAAHALGDVTEPTEKRRAVDALIAALDDNHPQVRMEACAALGDLGEPSALPHLIKKLDDGVAPVRQNAAIALGTLGHPDGFEPLATALKDGPPDLRFQAATSLAEIEPVRAFDHVLAALDDRDGQVVGAAALSVGAIAKLDEALKPRALSALRAKIDHGDASARFDVAYALAELGDEGGRAVLAKAATDVERAWDANSALGELGATQELARAVSAKKTPPEARVLAAGRLLAAGGGDDDTRGVLIDALTDRKIHVRGLAVEQLTAVGGPWAKAPLEKLARSGKGADLLEAIAAALRAIEGRS